MCLILRKEQLYVDEAPTRVDSMGRVHNPGHEAGRRLHYQARVSQWHYLYLGESFWSGKLGWCWRTVPCSPMWDDVMMKSGDEERGLAAPDTPNNLFVPTHNIIIWNSNRTSHKTIVTHHVSLHTFLSSAYYCNH
jgi:hypothetical protein